MVKFCAVLVLDVFGQRVRMRVHGCEYNPLWKEPSHGLTMEKDFTSHFHQNQGVHEPTLSFSLLLSVGV